MHPTSTIDPLTRVTHRAAARLAARHGLLADAEALIAAQWQTVLDHEHTRERAAVVEAEAVAFAAAMLDRRDLCPRCGASVRDGERRRPCPMCTPVGAGGAW